MEYDPLVFSQGPTKTTDIIKVFMMQNKIRILIHIISCKTYFNPQYSSYIICCSYIIFLNGIFHTAPTTNMTSSGKSDEVWGLLLWRWDMTMQPELTRANKSFLVLHCLLRYSFPLLESSGAGELN